MTSERFAVFEVRLVAADHGDPRERWNGEPMASEAASTALDAAVDAIQASLFESGFVIASTGYGVRSLTVAPEDDYP